jgi:hypothetical protein
VGFRLGVVALLALLLQAIAITAPLGEADILQRLLFVSSYVLLVVFVGFNLRRAGIALIGLGLLLNFAPIATNGGLMPVTSESLARIGEAHKLEGLNPGDAIPNTKNVWRERDDTHLWFLTDRLVWDNPVFFRVFSIGDIVIAAGVIVTLADLFLPRLVPVAVDDASKGTGRENGNPT